MREREKPRALLSAESRERGKLRSEANGRTRFRQQEEPTTFGHLVTQEGKFHTAELGIRGKPSLDSSP